MSSRSKQFQTVLHHDDPIVRDHTVHGVRIMPGVTFIDVVLRALSATGVDAFECELKKLLFHEPVAVANTVDRELRISIGAATEQGAKVRIESRGLGSDGPLASTFEENISCDVLFGAGPAAPSRIDLDALKAGAERAVDLDSIYALARSMHIEHGPFMKTHGRVYKGRDYVLAEVSLSETASAHADDFVLHPALMDAATLPYAALFYAEDSDIFRSPFIPIYVESFRALRAPTSRLHVLIRKGPETRALEDVLYNDIEVFDAGGAAVARFGRLGAKRIRSPELITRSLVADRPRNGARAQTARSSAQPAARDELGVTARVERALCDMVGAMLDSDGASVDTDCGFYDLGLESTDLLKLVQQLEQRTGRELYPTLLFEYSNIEKLAAFLVAEYGAEWAAAAPAVGEPEAPLAASTATNASPPMEAAPEILTPVWEAGGAWSRGTAPRGVLVLVSESALLEEARRNFADYEVVSVQLGAEYAVRSASEFVVDRRCREDYRRVLDAVAANGQSPVAIVQLAGPAIPGDEAASGIDARAYEVERASVEVAHALLGALVGAPEGVRAPFVHLTSELASGSGAAVAAMLRCARFEAPELRGKVIYAAGDSIGAARLGDCLSAELAAAANVDELEVRYTPAERAVRRLATGLRSPEPSERVPVPRERGVYIVSGGAGGLGLLLAEQWSARHDARLVLLGRSALSTDKARRLRELQDRGARVSYLQADVTKPEEVKRAVRIAKQRLGRINGVIHCAGVTSDSTLRAQRFADTEAVWATKVLGAIALDAATAHDELDFFLVFSSLSSLTGNLGQGAYAGANAWLDTWAARRSAAVEKGMRSGRSLSIAWPLWSVGGLHPGASRAEAMQRRFGLLELGPDEGIAAIDACFAVAGSQAVVFKGCDARVREALLRLAPLTPSRAGASSAPPAAASAKKPPSGPQLETELPGAMAIIGVSGRYPEAPDLQAFWANLCAGRDSISEVPAARWDLAAHFEPRRNTPGKSYSQWGGFLEGVDQFDPLFFNIGPHEAVVMDPQERLFLECAWSTLEDAGYTRSLAHDPVAARERRVGVFVGVMWHEYQLLALEETLRGNPVSVNASAASIANRVSYCLDLRGPSVPVDTMCSSSLMAIHLACESIRSGESTLALAGGVNLMLHPSKYTKLCQMQMLSSDGRCRSFAQGADGYVPGEGVGCVLIKPLERAIADGDHIYAVIRGTHVNHGGKGGGMTVPSPAAQAELIRGGLEKAGVPARSVSYVEAHGTGTALGDPIEIAGLERAFSADAAPPERCPIGSVKSNVGHLEAAAGIAAVTKVLLQLRHRTLVPSLHADELNASIDFASTPFIVQRSTEPWHRPVVDAEEVPRRASISSFGAGGVNVQMTLEEYSAPPCASSERGIAEIVVVSAKKESQLAGYVERLLSFVSSLKQGDAASPRFVDFAHTLRVGREPFRHRVAVVASSFAELESAWQAFLERRTPAAGVFIGDAKLGTGRSDHGPLRRGAAPSSASRLEQAASEWVLGGVEQLPELGGRPAGRRVPLPTYPFERKRYWIVEERELPRAADPLEGERAPFQKEPGSAVVRLRGVTERRLVELLAAEINLAPSEIEPDEAFESYGVDSVVGAKLLSRMEEEFGALPVALLLERRSIADVAAYLVEHRRERLTRADERPPRDSSPKSEAVATP